MVAVGGRRVLTLVCGINGGVEGGLDVLVIVKVETPSHEPSHKWRQTQDTED